MKFEPTDLPGMMVIEPVVHGDERGFFLETYQLSRYAAQGLDARFVQDNQSMSRKGILRGLHGQRDRPQGKLIRCIEGSVWDVGVDVRRGSPTFLEWFGCTLSAVNFRQLWVPPGFAHGFCVLSERAQIEYKCTDFYDPGDEYVVRWNDPDIGIEWPLAEPTLSARDKNALTVRELGERLPSFGELTGQ